MTDERTERERLAAHERAKHDAAMRERLRDADDVLGHLRTCSQAAPHVIEAAHRMRAALLTERTEKDGYFYLVDEHGRAGSLSWQQVALMLQEAGHDVMVQPGFRGAERTGERMRDRLMSLRDELLAQSVGDDAMRQTATEITRIAHMLHSERTGEREPIGRDMTAEERDAYRRIRGRLFRKEAPEPERGEGAYDVDAWCPRHGPVALTAEDHGACIICGALSVGSGADDALRIIRAASPEPAEGREPMFGGGSMEDRLRDLLNHAWVHSGYSRCGYQKMTSQQRALFDVVVGDPAPAEVLVTAEYAAERKRLATPPAPAGEDKTLIAPKPRGWPSCGICGGRQYLIRPRYPGGMDRLVCPTCLADRLEQVQQIASNDYGVAKSAAPQDATGEEVDRG